MTLLENKFALCPGAFPLFSAPSFTAVSLSPLFPFPSSFPLPTRSLLPLISTDSPLHNAEHIMAVPAFSGKPFRPQTSDLTPADLAAAWMVVEAYAKDGKEAVCFFKCGAFLDPRLTLGGGTDERLISSSSRFCFPQRRTSRWCFSASSPYVLLFLLFQSTVNSP